MSIILTTTLVIAAVGIVVGAGLVFTSRKFHVEVDPREAAVREKLPGNNCGACGFAGCDALAAAIAAGEASVNSCPVGGTPVAEQIGEIMGVSADAMVKKVAFVACKGNCEATHNQGNYVGISDCRAAMLSGISITECDYGCMGFGTCNSVCPNNAIQVHNGVAVVDRNLCVGCGLCVKACPKGLITLVPETSHIAVQCSNHDRGPAVKKVCSAGCIGCTLCTRQCERGAITVKDNLARVNYELCVQCNSCADKCPQKCIMSLRPPQTAQTAQTAQ